jgi:GNAT superfamily N-acetyltransferase
MVRSRIIRVVSASDAGAVATLRAEWTAEPSDDPQFVHRVAAWLSSEAARRTTWLAFDAEHPLGMVSLVEYRRMPHPAQSDSSWGYVGHLFVREQHRNNGVGTQLLETLIAAAQTRGYARLVLSPSVEAVPLFRKSGFLAADEASGHLLFVRPQAPEPQPQ